MGHEHGDQGSRSQNKRALGVVLGLTTGFLVVEVIAGFITGSLALLADAGHMLSDVLSLAIALVAVTLAERPPTPQRSFGLQRAEILAALANGVTLVLVSLWIFYEAAQRLSDPPEIVGGAMLVVAIGGLVVNLVGGWALQRGKGASLNVSAALRHVVADLLGSVGVITAALVILLTGWRYADPIISILIGFLVLGSAVPVIRDAGRVLLEAAPRGLDVKKVGRRMVEQPGVSEVHDLHVWTVTSGFPALAAHVLVPPDEDCHVRRRDLERLLRDEFGIDHTTLQVDHTRKRHLVQLESAVRPDDALAQSTERSV
jgi:cobalt-zinc-cadmium efflux system protein